MQIPGSKPCATHKFLNETYYAEYYDGSNKTGPRVTVHRNDGNIIQPKNGNMYVQTNPGSRFDFCICVGTSQDGAAPPAPVLGALRHDFAKDAILIGRERIKLEFLDRTVVADHWMKGPHNFWVEVATNQMVRGWQPYNGLQIWYDWDNTMPSDDKFEVPKGCYSGLLHYNVSCRSPPPGGPPSHKWGSIVGGLVSGLLSDQPEVSNCFQDARYDISDLRQAVADFKKKAWLEGFGSLARAVQGIPAVLDVCGSSSRDAKKLKEALKHITREELTHNLMAHKADIEIEVFSAGVRYKERSFAEAGKQLGMALRRVLETNAVYV